VSLDPDLKTLADGDNFAALTTLLADGQPQTQVMWVGADDDHLLINTEVHRAKYKNTVRDPRVTVTVWDKADPYRYVEARGRVVDEVRGDAARAHIDQLSQKYGGRDYPAEAIQTERITLKVAVDKVVKNNI
jgi:PPOX class probable F420-dependent enzyme